MPAGIMLPISILPAYSIGHSNLNVLRYERISWFHSSGRLTTPFPPRPNRTVSALHAAKYKMMKRVRPIRQRPNCPMGHDMTKSAAPLNTAVPCVIPDTNTVCYIMIPPPSVSPCNTTKKTVILKIGVNFRVSKCNTKKHPCYLFMYLWLI
jgi:hypothetical protein